MRFVCSLIIFLGLVSTNPALALIEGQLLVGQRTVDGDDSDSKATDTKLSVYVDPIPLVPVGFGLSFTNLDFDDDVTGTEISLDATAWLPIGIAGLKPYAKVAVVLSGEYTISSEGQDINGDVTGTRLAVGAKYSVLPLIAVMLEIEKSDVTVDFDGLSEIKYDALGILLGVAAGI